MVTEILVWWSIDNLDSLIDKVDDYLENSDIDDYIFGKNGNENDYRKSVREFIEDYND